MPDATQSQLKRLDARGELRTETAKTQSSAKIAESEETLWLGLGLIFLGEILASLACLGDLAVRLYSWSFPIASTGQHVRASSHAAFSSSVAGCLKTKE